MYYMWFRYLQLSERYQQACLLNGRGMEELYADFGNVFSMDFKTWWRWRLADGTPRGMFLFAEMPYAMPIGFASFEQVCEHRQAIEAGDALAILIPSHEPKTKVSKLIRRIMSEYKTKSQQEQHASMARYKVSNYTKNSIKSLKDGLRAVELQKMLATKKDIGLALMYEEYFEELYDGKTSLEIVADLYGMTSFQEVTNFNMSCHMYAARLLGKNGRVQANIRAVENAVPTEGQRGWGSFPAKL